MASWASLAFHLELVTLLFALFKVIGFDRIPDLFLIRATLLLGIDTLREGLVCHFGEECRAGIEGSG